MEAAQGNLPKVPILIELHEWDAANTDLLKFMERQFAICGLPDARLWIQMLLKRGEALVLFDGLDEVKQEQGRRKRMMRELRDFCDEYEKAQCVITCRIAATDYSFAGFQYVETIEAFPEDVWDKMQAVMLTAPFLLTKYVWPAMREQR